MIKEDNRVHLHNKAYKAILWSAIDIFGRYGVQLVISIILARLLTPSEFGVVAMLNIFIVFGNTFVDSGFSSALIQREKVTQIDLSSVFFFNLLLGAIVSIIMFYLAPYIAIFFNVPILNPLAQLSALSLFIGSFGSVQLALRNRDLDFKTQTKISLIAVITSGGLGILLAWKGCGVWSLAWQSITFTFISTILLWFFRPWRPSMLFSFASLSSLWSYGSNLLYSSLLNAIFSRLQLLLIGKFYSPVDLGFYTRAYSTQQLPAGLLSTLVSRVAFPLFSSIHNDNDMLRKGLKKAVSFLMMVNLPIMLGMSVTADSLVVGVFGCKWEPCVPYLQLLCIAGVFWPLHVINLNALKSMGYSGLFFRLDVIKKILLVLVLMVTFRFGIIAIVLGEVTLAGLFFVLNSYYLGKLLNYSTIMQFRDFSPFLLNSLIMVIACYMASLLPIQSILIRLLSQISVGTIIYIFLCYLLCSKNCSDFVTLIKSIVVFKKK